MKQKFKSYAFCLGVCVACVGVVVAIGNAFNFKVDEVALTSVLTALLGVFVALGFVVKEPEEDTLPAIDPTLEDDECLEHKEENNQTDEKQEDV